MGKLRIFNTKEENEVKRLKGTHKLAIKVKNKLLTNKELIHDVLESEKKKIRKKKITKSIKNKPRVKPIKTTEPKTLKSIYFRNQVKLREKQHKIFLLVNKIKSDPEDSIDKLKILVLFLKSGDHAIKYTLFNYAALALCDLFCEIIPDYKIQSIDEEGVKLKKQTQMLRKYEEGLLRYYKYYLINLKEMLEHLKRGKPKNVDEIAKQKLGLVALKCICKHIETNPHFNFTPELIKNVLPFGNSSNLDVRQIVIEALTSMFKNDKSGEISLEAVSHALAIAKKKKFEVSPDFLKIFLALNIKEVKFQREVENAKTLRSKRQKLSRNQKRHEKKLRDVEHSLLEASAQENKEKVLKNHTKIVEQIFNIYFAILKINPTSVLLTAVLEGLSKFSHLINVDFFDDLILLLQNILKEYELSCQEILHCLNTVFTILSGYGQALNIDPCGFYQPFYQVLLDFPALSQDPDNVQHVLKAFHSMFTMRKRSLPLDRVLAFIKRVAVISLCTSPPVTVALLAIIRGLMVDYPRANSMLDSELESGTSFYRPDIQDPDFCNARETTILPELRKLQHSKVSVISKFAQAILTESTDKLLPQLKKSPLEVYLYLTSLVAQ